MSAYTFYPRLPDGGCLTFTFTDLLDDAAALAHAETVLLAHPSAVEVTVWSADRSVGRVVHAVQRTGAANGKRLHGCAVLVLEDCYLLAEDVRKLLEHAGASVVGPYADAAAAVAAVDQERPSCAIIDIALGFGALGFGANFAPAKALLARGLPIAFLTGYGAEVVPPELSQIPHLIKPANGEAIICTVEGLCVTAACASYGEGERHRQSAGAER
jgi:hypothetical protein